MTFFLSIDQGTSGTKAIIFDEHGNTISKAIETLKSYYPNSIFVEQDPIEIYESVLLAVKSCLIGFEKKFPLSKENIVSCGISNQRETFVIWDKNGNPLHNAIVWQCKRSNEICENLKAKNLEPVINSKTGLTIDPYFSATKVMWLNQHNNQIQAAIDKREAYFGTIDTWLLFKLTDGKSYKTDHTNASRTLFYNIYNLDWDEELLKEYNLEKLHLPDVRCSADYFGHTSFEGLFKKNIPITGVIGDSQAAFFGEECFSTGMAKATLGTGSSILWNTTNSANKTNGMLTTIGWSLDGKVNYALEGVIVSCGATIEWMKSKLIIFDSYHDIEPMVKSIPANHGVFLIPAFSGMGAPYWQKKWKGSIHGLTFSSSKEHLLRAALESIAFQIKDVINAFEKETKSYLKELKVNGGMTENTFLMQFLADVLNKPITNVGFTDVSAWGAALISGLGIKFWEGITDLPKISQKKQKMYQSDQTNTSAKGAHLNWLKIIENKSDNS